MISQLLQGAAAVALVSVHASSNQPLLSALGFAILGYAATNSLIPKLGAAFMKIGLKGSDMSKTDKPVIPECMGAISAVVYLFLMFFFIPFLFIHTLVTTTGGGNRDGEVDSASETKFSHSKLAQYLSAVLCLESQVLLGIADDLFDVKWRHKFFMPAIASIPLLVVYYVDFGVTSILIPKFVTDLWPHVGTTVDLGVFYYVYMAAIAIFCPNSINILAGINGLEVGQSIVLALIFLINDCCYIFFSKFPASVSAHVFSACLLIPFLGVSVALCKHNWFPSSVFVGDTYCYFAGMVFAVVGILGHFSKTMLLFFIPQIFNFVYSVPQLFHIVPCPRHRLPRFDAKSGKMYPSMADLGKAPNVVRKVLYILSLVKLVKVDVEDGEVVRTSNLTIINLALVWFGPLREDKLCMVLLGLQFAIGVCAIIGRHTIGPMLFGFNNLWN